MSLAYPKPHYKKRRKVIGRTEAQKEASLRDGRWCLWCLHRGILSPLEEVHHLFGRARSDELKSCIGLCADCHMEHHRTHHPSTHELVTLMEKRYHYDYADCAEFMKAIAN